MKKAARPETNRPYRTICRWWKDTEVLVITGATIGKVEANTMWNGRSTPAFSKRPGLNCDRGFQELEQGLVENDGALVRIGLGRFHFEEYHRMISGGKFGKDGAFQP